MGWSGLVLQDTFKKHNPGLFFEKSTFAKRDLDFWFARWSVRIWTHQTKRDLNTPDKKRPESCLYGLFCKSDLYLTKRDLNRVFTVSFAKETCSRQKETWIVSLRSLLQKWPVPDKKRPGSCLYGLFCKRDLYQTKRDLNRVFTVSFSKETCTRQKETWIVSYFLRKPTCHFIVQTHRTPFLSLVTSFFLLSLSHTHTHICTDHNLAENTLGIGIYIIQFFSKLRFLLAKRDLPIHRASTCRNWKWLRGKKNANQQ